MPNRKESRKDDRKWGVDDTGERGTTSAGTEDLSLNTRTGGKGTSGHGLEGRGEELQRSPGGTGATGGTSFGTPGKPRPRDPHDADA